ncbi:hypothetical protein BCL57_002040 [Agromyces flavus]|uniref:FHA domain-containing protein n=1 Tax=Agromyces flavus TaxID=589382 RepID=A0A1H1PRE8_9MICO|nr:FHA domain-containing protein [Agromyces flavus]MCP2367881.1 hypothetical protein [Agromyces flavus]GGI47342.1 hypothetical protein GCM10010932_20300 [Agromyces flavus]SDS13319.1 hypothetical protein SAMN04489721_0825 [Agromyces flavus]
MSEPDFIVPPPGLVPDAPDKGTTTGATPDRTIRAPDRLPVFRPVTPVAPPPRATRPALPTQPPGEAPVPSSMAAAPAAPAAPARPRAWRLRSADGIEFVVHDRVVAGRDPQPDTVPGGGTPVAILDTLRSVSKTHVLLVVEVDRLLATDLRSTNGVRIWPEGGDPIELEPGIPTPVPAEAVLLLGDVAFLADVAPEQDEVP